jgi:hypothetical protein
LNDIIFGEVQQSGYNLALISYLKDSQFSLFEAMSNFTSEAVHYFQMNNIILETQTALNWFEMLSKLEIYGTTDIKMADFKDVLGKY